MQHSILNNIINFQEMQYLLRGLKNFLFNLCIRNILYAVFQVYFFRHLGIYNEFLQPLSAAASERRLFAIPSPDIRQHSRRLWWYMNVAHSTLYYLQTCILRTYERREDGSKNNMLKYRLEMSYNLLDGSQRKQKRRQRSRRTVFIRTALIIKKEFRSCLRIPKKTLPIS